MLDCNQYDQHINDCRYLTKHSCRHRDDVSVTCYGPILNITDVRLADGTGPYDGRAEIKVNGTWGTICDKNFNINDADVFCNMLGLKGAQFFTGARHGEGSGPVYVDEYFCHSYNTDLSECKYLFQNSCRHDRDVSVVCNECGQPDIYYWDVGYFSYNGTTLYADCSYYKTYIGTLQMTCDNVTKQWITKGQCQEYSYPLAITDTRLVGGNRTSRGRVELKVMGTWGTICDHGFGIEEANTVCNMIGYAPAFEVYSGAYYGEGKGPIFVDDLICSPSASHINNCTYITYDNCKHPDDVSVICTDCGDPTPQNGFINSTYTYYGTVVKVTCNEGYRLVGNSVIKCELNNHWSDLSTCNLIDCGDPTPKHGSSNATVTTNGSVVIIACDTGYNLSGNAVITCQSNEMWTEYPTCEIVDCGLPLPLNADVTLPGNKTTYSEIAVISCLVGYRPDGSSPVSCLANGTWESWPTCTIIDCRDPTPSKGHSNDTNTTYGTVISITCADELNISGNSTIICQADGTWSDTPVCDASDCGILSVSNAKVKMSNGSTIDSLAYVNCNQGYELKGSPVVACTSTGWNDSVSCIKLDCADPTPENGQLVEIDGTDFGSVAKIECNTGYELLGDNIITCQDGGIWSDNPKCKIRDCGQPTPLPENAFWDDSEGTAYNTTIKFVCKDGFLLVGEESIVCRSTGVWSSHPPVCVEKVDIGGQCSGDEYCHTRDAVCVNAVCTCKSNVYDERTNKCDTMPILPYGGEQNDLAIQPGEVCGSKVSFAPGIPLFDKLHKDLYVCSNGLISFDSRYTNPTPPKDRDTVSDLGSKAIIAPFYSPIDKTTGSVFYRTYDILKSYQKIEADKASPKSLIIYLEKMVKVFGGLDKFETSFVLLATWDAVKPASIDYDKTKTSTFQVVLISDGTSTFTLFIYGHGLMQWRHKGTTFPQIWVGYTVNASYLYTHSFSFFPHVLGLDMVEQSLPNSYIGVAGLVFKPLTDEMESQPNHAVDCIRWYNDNLEEKQTTDVIASRLPDCPCDIWLSRFDPWFWNIRRWLQVPYTCVDMFPGQIYQPYGKSCCYDLSTWLWTNRRPVAGSFYRYHPKHKADHYQHDVYPKQVCCELSRNCKLFYDLRPTGACYRNSPYDFGIFWGDPHFRTLDGLPFTFNGLGEYTLLQVRTENFTFDLQARTERARKKDGTLSDATVFSAFAAMESSGASIHVELNQAKTGINLYGNNADLTQIYIKHIQILKTLSRIQQMKITL
ncbi:deleted in malignant brain tumors 1 protein-like [Mercenaria mercenaria]|uniref:deleted in malignant brain tumors 1 protein-like n=1 Tax=Mercenaria mercenaria TaxID=6596 RepID=UPI00234F2217|nr:deleted in malignant brain tumors 1 protein-like [Mercenaria mercenaria]